MHTMQSRRDFLSTLSAVGAAGIFGAQSSLADEGPPEVTTIRLPRDPSICIAPEQIADELLRAEGFTDIRYVQVKQSGDAVVRGEVDFASETAAWVVSYLDAGEPITALAGIHIGCYELFAHEPVRTISELKGKKVGIYELGSSGHLLLAIMAAQVGLDPHNDIDWVASGPAGTPIQLFADEQVHAFLGFPPEPQELRARKIGRVISTLPPTGRGRIISAARNSATGISSGLIRSRPNATCAPSSRLPRCAPPNRRGRRSVWSMPGSPGDTPTRCRR